MKKLLKHLIIFSIVTSLTHEANANRFSSTLFFLYDTENTIETTEERVQNIKNSNTGIYLSLFYNIEKDEIQSHSVDTTKTLLWYSKLIIEELSNNKERLLPIFISYSGPYSILEKELKNSGLDKFCFSQPNGEKWPLINEMISSNKRVVLFCLERTSEENPILHYAWDFVADLPYSGNPTPSFTGVYSHGKIENELLLVRDFISPQHKREKYNDNKLDVTTESYYMNYLRNAWEVTGKFPTFVLTPFSTDRLTTLDLAIRSYTPIYGKVNSYNVPLKKVMWDNSSKSITNGNFCFPFTPGEEIILKAHCPGYNFKDSKLRITDRDVYTEQELVLEAIPHEISSGLSVYFNFENEINNLLLPDKPIKIENCKIVSDRQRGNVLKAGSSSSIEIGDGDHFGIRNNSFTVSTWIKLNEEVQSRDYSIIGTKAYRFREGLHLVIRENRPYFGLFGNDYSVNYEFERKKWYHIVFRYDITNGEQAIFINGVKKGASLDHPSFIGMDNLTMCSSLGNRNPLYGYLDDFCIWRRTLGEDEIFKLYKTGIPVDFKSPHNLPHYLLAIAFSLILVTLIIRRYFIKQKDLENQKGIIVHNRFQQFENNTKGEDALIKIKTFGEFEIFDANYKEIGHELSKQLSKILILLICQQSTNNNQLKIKRLTDCIWPDSEAKKATNSRNVAITKLRKFLDKHKIGEINCRNNSLELVLSENVTVDLLEFESILNKRTNNTDIQTSINIIDGGKLFRNYQENWLEPYKFEISSKIIELCEMYLTTHKGTNHFDLIIAERLLMEDEFNQIGFTTKIQSLYLQGQINKVKSDYAKFTTTYKEIYNEAYRYSLEETIKLTDVSIITFPKSPQVKENV